MNPGVDDALTVGCISARVNELVKCRHPTHPNPRAHHRLLLLKRDMKMDPSLLVSSPCLVAHNRDAIYHWTVSTWVTHQCEKQQQCFACVCVRVSVIIYFCFAVYPQMTSGLVLHSTTKQELLEGKCRAHAEPLGNSSQSTAPLSAIHSKMQNNPGSWRINGVSVKAQHIYNV